MASLVNFVRSAFNRRKDGVCLVLGLDAAGKTTFLYKVALGEVVTTIPTIGFNVETIKIGKHDVAFWDVGGCDKIRPLVRHYFVPGMVILFMLDIHDERRSGALEELHFQVLEAVSNFGVAFVGIVFTKQDLPYNQEAKEAAKFAVQTTMKTFRTVKWKIFDDNVSAVTGKGIQGVLDAVGEALDTWDPKSIPINPTDEAIKPPQPEVIPTTEELLKRIQGLRDTKATTYRYPELYLSNMRSGKLGTWDHADHLFVASVILHKVLENPSQTTTPQQPVLVAVDEFLDCLGSLLKEAPGKFRNTAHRTLTTFWVHQVYVALHRFQEPVSGRLSEWPDKFFAMLEKNPHLMNGSLWKDHYTKNYLLSPKGKDNLLIPDLEPLPTFEGLQRRNLSTGYDSKRLGEDQAARRLKRWAYATLQTVKATNTRRGLVVKKALSDLQTETIRQRAKSSLVEPYSETQAYFWIQIVHAGMEGILKKSPDFDFTRISYETIEILYPDAFGADDLWKEYYQEADWKGVKGRLGFILPKKGKIIPNYSPILEIHQDWKTAVSEVIVPTMEELRQRADWISNYQTETPKKEEIPMESKKSSYEPIDARTTSFHENDDDDDWVEVDDIATATSKVKISDTVDQAPNYGTVSKSQLPPPEQPATTIEKTTPPSPQSWQEHAELIQKIFNILPKKRSEIVHTHISRVAYKEINKDRSQLTKMTFWVRMIIEAYIDTYGPSLDGSERKEEPITMHDFLSKNLELSWEDLWLVYYTELTWKSASANETILGCDRKQLRSVRGWKEQNKAV
ncbi:hypothetical protein H072_603 [Dactylellina haptotyla CBS 200.50]|uniref:ADP-ribosylation factor n=1 Tax=Dactylellina haptotyla (strain CBS 200.50) TaxID=1284197 RepID=S8AR41_DACHA|nr:hypothetical protein H072_603 [Dactylellina haptotyla CBS 200.50]